MAMTRTKAPMVKTKSPEEAPARHERNRKLKTEMSPIYTTETRFFAMCEVCKKNPAAFLTGNGDHRDQAPLKICTKCAPKYLPIGIVSYHGTTANRKAI